MRFLAKLCERLRLKAPDERAAEWRFDVPADTLLFAIGDIHGEARKLDRLLAKIAVEAERGEQEGLQTKIIFLGDLIDRGPDSKAVLERLTSDPLLRNARFLMGNHEQAMMDFLQDPLSHRAWLDHGGLDTLGSFGIVASQAVAGERLIEIRDVLASRLTPSMRHFLSQLEDYVIYGDYLFVHAGLRPGVPLDEQRQEDLFWIREPFLSSRRHHGYRVVHGHTIVDTPAILPNRVGIDTGAYAGGSLTAAFISKQTLSFLTDL